MTIIKQQDIVTSYVQIMKDKGVIQESQSPWSGVHCYCEEKNGSYRFCFDYRKLNDVTSKDCYHLPNIEDTFNTLSDARFFCSLDLKEGILLKHVDIPGAPYSATSYISCMTSKKWDTWASNEL